MRADCGGSCRYNCLCVSESRRSVDIPVKGPFDELLRRLIGSQANAQPAS